MRNILLVIKNNLQRLIKDKLLLCMMIIVLPIIVYLGIFFSQMDGIKGKLAIVGANLEQESMMKELIKDNSNVNLVFLEEKPTNTDLIKGIYLAEINLSKGEPEVISYGREELKLYLEGALKGEVYTGKVENPVVEAKIIGFLIMFLFFGSLMVIDNFLTDRENGVYVRVLNGKLSYFQYMIGQVLYSIATLTLPTLILSLMVLKILAVELSMSIGLLSLLIVLVGLLSSSFSVLISTICKSKVSVIMGGSAITMITCLLGGCLVNIVDSNKIMGFIRNLIPQKRLIDLANGFNNEDLIFIVATIILFITFSLIVGKKQYENGEFI
jgi:ABC-2 type transport system permease protein